MATVNGTNGADTLYGTGGSDAINGLGGNDVLKGFGGADRLDGGAGIDAAFYDDSTVGVSVSLATGRGFGGSAEGDTLVSIENLYGSRFNDTLTGNDGNNDLYGLSGNDVLKGGGGTDGLAGGDGDDILKGGGGADYLEGGAGIDTADYSQAPADPQYGIYGVSVDLRANQGFWSDAQGDTFSGVENVTGSPYHDFLVGTDGANYLRGLDGGDELRGYGGNDRLEGGGGNDRLDGGAGVDTMIGRTGDDSYTVDNSSDVVVESAGQGSDWVFTSASYALAPDAEVETFTTTNQNETAAISMTGSDTRNYIIANEGTNVINAGGGDDTLDGRGGNDTLNGGPGSDLLIGAAGFDNLTGGSGADTFLWQRIEDTGLTSGTADVIFDFAAGDRMYLVALDADIYTAGNQAFTFIGAAPFSGTPGEINYVHSGGDTLIQMQTGTSADVEGVIRIAGIHTPDASWFVL